jgi:DDE superfamily endonuclease
MCSTSARAVLLVDQAGCYMTDKLAVPDNITILPLPAKCPELNPTENVWQFLRDNWLSNRVFRSSIATILQLLDAAYPARTAIKLILDNHSAHISKETKAWLAQPPAGRFEFTSLPSMAPG